MRDTLLLDRGLRGGTGEAVPLWDTRMAPKLEGTGLRRRAVGSAFLGL